MNTHFTKTIKGYAAAKVDRMRDEVRANVREMLAAEAPAGELAGAFAAGTLISTIPVPLVDMVLAAWVTKRYSEMPRAPFFTGMALANNLFMAPLYASTPRVGGFALHWLSNYTPLVAPEAILIRILVGYLLIALGLALGAYVLASTGFRGYQATRRLRPITYPDLTSRPDRCASKLSIGERGSASRTCQVFLDIHDQS